MVTDVNEYGFWNPEKSRSGGAPGNSFVLITVVILLLG